MARIPMSESINPSDLDPSELNPWLSVHPGFQPQWASAISVIDRITASSNIDSDKI
jgi:hypothetical protein